jgi:hypothetical protein
LGWREYFLISVKKNAYNLGWREYFLICALTINIKSLEMEGVSIAKSNC